MKHIQELTANKSQGQQRKLSLMFGGVLGLILLTGFQNCSKLNLKLVKKGDSSSLLSRTRLNHVQPALVVRSSACITCHTNINSNYVTDFGFDGDGAGKNYYFGNMLPSGILWNSGSIYGDHGAFDSAANKGSFSTMNFLKPSAKVIVPAAPVYGEPNAISGKSSLAGYVQDRLSLSSSPTSRSATVVEKRKVFIGAPTDSKILNAFRDANGKIIPYYKTSDSSAELSGIALQNGIYRNTSVVACEGDLLVPGLLHLENLQLNSRTGCRIYATGTVLIYGPIQYVNKTDNTNLQITSSRAIVMGQGSILKNGRVCEVQGEYYFDALTNPANAAVKANYDSSLKHRFQTLWTIPSHFLRENKTPQALADDVYNDAMTIQAGLASTLLDASCRPETRNVSYERLLLNAPQVQSRYRGNFKGVIIAEFALMSLGQFVFEYDHVFDQNSVFPMLLEEDFLLIAD